MVFLGFSLAYDGHGGFPNDEREDPNQTLKGATITTIWVTGAPTALPMSLTDFDASCAKNMLTTRLTPNVISVAWYTTLSCALRHIRKAKGTQLCPNYAKRHHAWSLACSVRKVAALREQEFVTKQSCFSRHPNPETEQKGKGSPTSWEEGHTSPADTTHLLQKGVSGPCKCARKEPEE